MLTESTGSSPPVKASEYELMITVDSFTMKKSIGRSPALRTVMVACGMCVPVTHFANRSGEALLRPAVKWMS